MRRLILFAGAASLACASIQAPSGGPNRTVPPALLSVTPESGAVNVTDRNAVFTFDAIVDDRAGRGGKLAGSFLVSPSDGAPIVSWKRDHIEVRPRGGFKPGVAYSVTMLPGVSDLNRNVVTEKRVVMFSTGDSIPPYAVHGRVFDWQAERIAVDARVELVRMPDSLTYHGVTDSLGQFVIGPLVEGTYEVLGLADRNNNGQRDNNEIWDSTTVTVKGTSPFVELRAALRDTIGPRLLTVSPLDSATLQLSFDKPLDASTPVNPPSIRIQRADSSRLGITQIRTIAQHQRARAVRDSVIAAAKRDSSARADTTTRRPPPAENMARPASTATAQPKPSVPAPSRDIVVSLDSASILITGASYRVTAVDMRSITGVRRTSDRAVIVPKRDSVPAGRRP